MSSEKEPQNQKPEQSVSLAELSRQYLQGKMNLNDYLAIEREVAPRLGASLLSIEVQLEASKATGVNRQQPSAKDSKEREKILSGGE